MTSSSLDRYLDDLVERLVPRLRAAVDEPEHSYTPRLKEALRHTLLAGGKRVRPAVIGLWAGSNSPRDLVLDAQVAVELIHTASLILDDLPSMDDARLRRGKPCCHLVFGVDTAILAATALLVRGFEYLGRIDAALPRAGAVLMFTRAVGLEGMIGGQHVDLHLEPERRDLDSLEYIHRHKTGVLFEACGRLGCRLHPGPEDLAERREEVARIYSRNLGLAFQIKDDLLDATGYAEEMGKDARQDRGKPTFASVLGEAPSREVMHRLLATARESLHHTEPVDPLLAELCSFVEARRK